MKHLITLFLVFFSNFCFSQQIVELCPENKLVFEYYSDAGVNGQYVWTIGNQTYTGVPLIYTWESIGNYIINLEFTSGAGCVSSSTFEVFVIECPESEIFIPNAFSPINDTSNETFLPKGYRIKNIEIRVFNRWGEQLYYSFNDNIGWDGKYMGELCKMDLYIYLIKWENIEGSKFQKLGSFTLLR